MHVSTLESCCSIIEISDLYGINLAVFNDELNYFLSQDYELDDKEYPTCILATTNNLEQPEAVKFLREMKFKEIPFFGRHQKKNIETDGKRVKYTSLWLRTSLPKGIITMAKRNQRDYRKY